MRSLSSLRVFFFMRFFVFFQGHATGGRDTMMEVMPTVTRHFAWLNALLSPRATPEPCAKACRRIAYRKINARRSLRTVTAAGRVRATRVPDTCAWRRSPHSAPQVAPAPLRKVGGAGGNSAEAARWRAGGDDPDSWGGQELRQRSPKLCDDSDPSGGKVLLNATVKNRLEKLCEPVEPPQSCAPPCLYARRRSQMHCLAHVPTRSRTGSRMLACSVRDVQLRRKAGEQEGSDGTSTYRSVVRRCC